jgi:hypothetical protein
MPQLLHCCRIWIRLNRRCSSSARLIYRRIIGWNECMVTRHARLKDFITDGYPSSGLAVQALAEDHVGTYILPFSCERITVSGGTAQRERQFRRTSLGGVRCRQEAETARPPLSSRPKRKTDDLISSRNAAANSARFRTRMIFALLRAEPAQRAEVPYFHLERPWEFYREMAITHGTGYGVPVKGPHDHPFAKMSLSHDIIRSRRLKACLVTYGFLVARPESNCYSHSLAVSKTS